MQQNSAPIDQSLLEGELNTFLQSFGKQNIYNAHGMSGQTNQPNKVDKLSDRELRAALDLLDVAFEKVDLNRIDTAKVHLQFETQKALYEAKLLDYRSNMYELRQQCDDLQAENVKLRAFINELHAIVK